MKGGGGKSTPRLSFCHHKAQLSRLAAPFFSWWLLWVVVGLIVVWRAQRITPPDATVLGWTGMGIFLILAGIADRVGWR